MSDTTRSYNVGTSDYAKHKFQVWDIWNEYNLDPWRADIVKRTLRRKGETPEEIKKNRKLDLQKIIHIAQYLLDNEE